MISRSVWRGLARKGAIPIGGPGLRDFLPSSLADTEPHEALPSASGSQGPLQTEPLRFSLETFGCQMNVSDSEIVTAILCGAGHQYVANAEDADLVLLNTCAVRDTAERKVWTRLQELRSKRRGSDGKKRAAPREAMPRPNLAETSSAAAAKVKVVEPTLLPAKPYVGVLGCMAERLKDELLEEQRLVDLVVGPDAYRDLPRLLDIVQSGYQAMNVQLSLEETYADVPPVRIGMSKNGTQAGARWQADAQLGAFISIMRGCNNMCSFCIVPFTRGRERSRPASSIVDEVRQLQELGIKEITLLGQNVNSYHDKSWSDSLTPYSTSNAGFSNTYRLRDGAGMRFSELLDRCSLAAPDVRFRFTSPHPKDFPPELLDLIAERSNVCKSLHLPLQSGSSSMLDRMRRGYTKEAFMQLVCDARSRIPGVSLSTDTISGFCGETEAEHLDTLEVMRYSRFEFAYMFAYSQRARTRAAHRMADDVPEDTKIRRLQEVIAVHNEGALRSNAEEVGRVLEVLVEGPSRRSTDRSPQFTGRSDHNKRCLFSPGDVAEAIRPGDLIKVKVTQAASPRSLLCEVLPQDLEEGQGHQAQGGYAQGQCR